MARTSEPGSPRANGARGSGPASTDSSSARSPTLRAIGPPVERVSQYDGGRPVRHPADARAEPDDPAERRRVAQRAAEVGAVGERDHPGRQGARRSRRWSRPADRVGSTGLRVVPKTGLNVCDPAANSGTLVLPIVTAPALRIRSTSRRSVSGTWSAKSGEPYVVRQPATSWVSLKACGRPCSGPVSLAPGERLVGGGRTLPGALLVEGDDRVELGVALGDPGQVQVEQLAGGDLAGSHGRHHRPGGGVDGEVSHRHTRRIRHTGGSLGALLGHCSGREVQRSPAGRGSQPARSCPPAAEQPAHDDAGEDQAGAERRCP